MLMLALVGALLCRAPAHKRFSLLDAIQGQAFPLFHVWGVTGLLTARDEQELCCISLPGSWELCFPVSRPVSHLAVTP